MSLQMTTIQIDLNAAVILQALQRKAEAQGVTLESLLKPLAEDEAETLNGENQHPARNEGMLAVLERTRERWKKMQVSGSTEDSLEILRQGRAGEMYGYEPIEEFQRSGD